MLRPDLFLGAQAAMLDQARFELMRGRKESHWIWFVFPQHIALGFSSNAKLFGLTKLDAEEYARHDILAPRLNTCVILASAHRDIKKVLGETDTMKYRSCLTLFEKVSPKPMIFATALEQHFENERCQATLELLDA